MSTTQRIRTFHLYMKLAGTPVSIILIMFAAAFLFLKHSLFSNPLLLFSLFNTIVLAILFGRFRPCTYEVDEILHFFGSSDELEVVDMHENIMEYSDDENDCDHEYRGSDGYDDDDDDDGSNDEVGWEDDDSSRDDEGSDDNLKKRIEDFIAEAYNRWKEEKLRDKLRPY